MDHRRRPPDSRSPVQPVRTGPVPVIIAIVVLAGAAWTLRDTWPSADPAFSSRPDEDRAVEPSTATDEAVAQHARGNLTALFSPSDYPDEAQRNDEQGTVSVRLAIDERGQVSDCVITGSSGSRALDSATCRILSARARFSPATDSEGRAVRDTYSQQITWRLED